MPIYRLFEGQAFEPEQCEGMGAAFEAVLQELGLKDRRDDPLCAIVAKKIIEFGHQGVRDPVRLRELTVAALRG